MYRLLLCSMLFGVLSPYAFGDETSSGERQRLPDLFADPASFQARAGENETSHSTRPTESADASRAPLYSPTPHAEAANTSLPGRLPSQQHDISPIARLETRGSSPQPNAPLPISRNTAAAAGAAGGEKGDAKTPGGATASTGIDSLMTVVGGLSIVVGLFLVTMWCLRRGMPMSARSLPPEVVEVLGRAPLAGRQQMHLIRFGNKLVLAAVSPAGVDTISEITDPIEANRLAGYCEQTQPQSATASFRGILDRLEDHGMPDAHEQPRRNRGLASLVGRKGSAAEDEYA